MQNESLYVVILHIKVNTISVESKFEVKLI